MVLIQSANTLPVLNGNEYLHEDRIDGVNGKYSAIYIDDRTIKIEGEFLDGQYQGGVLNTRNRIVGAVSLERFIYTFAEQNINDLYMCVVMNDVEISKDRNTYSDAIYTPVNGSEIRLTAIDGFRIFVLGNVTKQIASQEIVDVCRHDLLLPILKSVYGVKFPTGLANETDYRTIFAGHSASIYTPEQLKKAIYIHEYSFQMCMEITQDDSVEPGDTIAFRDVDYSKTVGTQDMRVTIDLDDEPLDRG